MGVQNAIHFLQIEQFQVGGRRLTGAVAFVEEALEVFRQRRQIRRRKGNKRSRHGHSHARSDVPLRENSQSEERKGCEFCAKAKQQLKDAGVEFAQVDLPHTIRTRALGAIAKARTVPQLLVNGELLGGGEAVEAIEKKGKLA